MGFGRRWQNGQREGASYQPKSTPGTPKLPNEALQITFQLTKTIRGPSKGVGGTFEKIQKNQDSQYVPRPPPRMVRLSDLESAWKCSRSDGLEMRIPKVTLKSKIGHLEPELGNVEKIQDLNFQNCLSANQKKAQI